MELTFMLEIVYNNVIRKITSSGVVSTFSGNSTAGYVEGSSANAEFNYPTGLVLDGSGNIIVADQLNQRIRKISSSGTTSFIAGSGIQGFLDGSASSAKFNLLSAIAVDGSGNIYVADATNNAIRKLTTPNFNVSTIAGSPPAGGYQNGTGNNAYFLQPVALYLDGTNLLVADANNSAIRNVAITTSAVTTLAGSPSNSGFQDGSLAGGNTLAKFNRVNDVAVDNHGNLIVADWNNNRIRKITQFGVVSTIAGTGTAGSSGDGGLATSAQLNGPGSVIVDGSGNIIFSDFYNNKVRKISTSGIITTIAGNGTQGHIDAIGTNAEFAYPAGLGLDANGNIFLTDAAYADVRKITTSYSVSTWAGTGIGGYLDGPRLSAKFNVPYDLSTSSTSDIYVCDQENGKIRLIKGVNVSTLTEPAGTTLFPSGCIYTEQSLIKYILFCDDYTNQIWKIDLTNGNTFSVIAGSGVAGYQDGAAASAKFNYPEGIITVNSQIYVAGGNDNCVRKIIDNW